MKFFKKLWKELNRVRSVEFVSYDTEEEIQSKLQAEFRAKKQEIMQKNYLKLMQERLIPFVRDFELTKSGILLTDAQIFEIAHGLYIRAKQDGKLDELNSLKGV